MSWTIRILCRPSPSSRALYIYIYICTHTYVYIYIFIYTIYFSVSLSLYIYIYIRSVRRMSWLAVRQAWKTTINEIYDNRETNNTSQYQ